MSQVQAKPTSRWRRWAFRAAAVGLSLVPLLVVEGVLRAGGYGETSESGDPYVSFEGVQPLFVKNEAGDRYEIPKSRQEFFRPESFAAVKRPGEFRIFCLGGSTVQGRPYAIETSFTTWLELSLNTVDAGRTWDVVNCGGVSYASYRLVPILQEVLGHQPDLIVLYTGHNEFLEDRTYAAVQNTPRPVRAAHRALSNLRTYQALRNVVHGEETKSVGPKLPKEVDAVLDYQQGLDFYQRDDAWREGVIEHFDFNLRRMVRMAQAARVPVVLVQPVVNLKDCPPFKSESSNQLSPEESQRFQQLWQAAADLQGEDLEQEIQLLKQAAQLDERHAGVHYFLGRCYFELRQYDKAKVEFQWALDEDICPLRILSPMQEIIRQVSYDFHVPLIDVEQRFQQQSPDGLPGRELMMDHVHPTVFGHQLIADLLFQELHAQGRVAPLEPFRSQRDARWLAHLESLDTEYFVRGQERLDGLMRWAAGRARRVKLSKREQRNPSLSPQGKGS